MADPTVPVLIPADTYPQSGPGGRIIIWKLDPTGPAFTKWSTDVDGENLRYMYGQGTFFGGDPAWAVSGDGDTDGVWSFPEDDTPDKRIDQTTRGGGPLRGGDPVGLTTYNTDNAGYTTPDAGPFDITFDNTDHRYRCILLALTIRAESGDPSTVTPPDDAVSGLDTVSDGCRFYISEVLDASADVFTWHIDDPANSTWVILAHDGARFGSGVYGPASGVDPAPHYPGIATGIPHRRFAFTLFGDDGSWFSPPAELLGLAGPFGPPAPAIALGLFDPGEDSDADGLTSDGGATWVTYVNLFADVSAPAGNALYLFANPDGSHSHPRQHLTDGTFVAEYTDHDPRDTNLGMPVPEMDVHAPSNTMWTDRRYTVGEDVGAPLMSVDLTTGAVTNHGAMQDLWPTLLDTANELVPWDITVRGTDELALAWRRFGGTQTVPNTVVVARVALDDLSLIDWTEIPLNFLNPVMFDRENDGWWSALFDFSGDAPYIPDIYFCDADTLTNRLVATMPTGGGGGGFGVGAIRFGGGVPTYEVDPLSFLAIPA